MKKQLTLILIASMAFTTAFAQNKPGGGRKPVVPKEGVKAAAGTAVKNEAFVAALGKSGLSSEVADRFSAARITPSKKLIESVAGLAGEKKDTCAVVFDTALMTKRNAEGLNLDHLSPQAKEMAETMIKNSEKMSTKVVEDYASDSTGTMDGARIAEAAKSLALSREQLSNEVEVIAAYENHKKVLGRDPKELEKCF